MTDTERALLLTIARLLKHLESRSRADQTILTDHLADLDARLKNIAEHDPTQADARAFIADLLTSIEAQKGHPS